MGEAVGLKDALRAIARGLLPRPARRALRIAAAELPHRVRDFVPDLLNRDGLPPASLRYRVAGSSDRRTFVAIGRQGAGEIVQAVTRHRAAAAIRDVLDFGCGCGRIARHLPALLPDARISGIDVDEEAIEWCVINGERVAASSERENTRASRESNGPSRSPLAADRSPSDWHTIPPDPPSTLPDNAYDLVYAVSVFTHLDEERQSAWIAELRRLLRDGGLLVVTTLGPGLVWTRPDLDAAQRERLAAHGFVFAGGKASFNEDSSFQTRDYLAQHWRGFRLLEQTAHGLASYQDLSVFVKN